MKEWVYFLKEFTVGYGDYNQRLSRASHISKSYFWFLLIVRFFIIFIYLHLLGGPVTEFRKFLIKKDCLSQRVHVVNIDEFNTSCKCHRCGNQLNSNRYLLYPNGVIYDSWGVLGCKSSCSMSIDRDHNATKNIFHLLDNYLQGLDRPSWLTKPY